MNKIHIIAVGALKEQSLLHLAKDYQKRISPYAWLKVQEVKAVSFSEATKKQAKQQEKEALLKVLHSYEKEQIYFLTEKGSLFNSEKFAEFISSHDGRDLVFVIGGSLGFEEDFLQNYQSLSLSALTFPHELARVILLEQLYRAFTINQGKNYHY
ncbi:MAG: 23S rRNA (pseudouridine(1915)-N(3))-methyltransferase RlmH [Patescibacteria group bacterium]|jgi:23S rRNA (pseudouridine1915-N3)-methyltransferase|nr:23S rRNA (pseudouridine(1915)-N(3))-methyltransferase RlmH [Patescibacteria group bacterium]